jgi:hypothetical protein
MVRLASGVKGNKYIFAIPHYSDFHIQGYRSINEVCGRVKLERKDLMTAMNLRRYIGTMSQVLQLKTNESEWLARHKDHNMVVHKDFYQLHHSTLEPTRVSMLLTLMDKGKASRFANRQLSDITLEGNSNSIMFTK